MSNIDRYKKAHMGNVKINKDGQKAGGRSYGKDGQKAGGRSYDKDGQKAGGRNYNKDVQKTGGRSYSKDGQKAGGRSYGENKKSNSKCPVSRLCGGCKYIDMEYKLQLQEKQKYMEELLGEFGEVDPIIGMENPFNYRNKVTAAFHRKKSGEVIAGVYEEGTHKVVEVNNCFIENTKASAIIKTIASFVKSFKIQIYNEDTGTGLLRHVQIRTADTTGQIMVTMITASPVFPSKNNFAKALKKAHPEITTIVQNINMKDTSMVLGKRNQVMYGRGFIEDELCGKRFRISPNSFYQVNPVQTEVLYKKAIKYADLKKKEVVVDAYCGIGTIGIVASDTAKKVIGVELNSDAIKDAMTNARLNEINNIDFYNNDAGVFMTEMAEEEVQADIVFMDPPRSGSTEEFMSSVTKLAPKKVIYISCGPETLARDLKYLTKHGYRVLKISPVDMFPMTGHVETVVLMSRKDK